MAVLGAFFRQDGLYVREAELLLHEPQPSIAEAELREEFAIIDRALAVADESVVGCVRR
jgi:hypothetical protein